MQYLGRVVLLSMVAVLFVWVDSGCTEKELDYQKFDNDSIRKASEWNIPLASVTVRMSDLFENINTDVDIIQSVNGSYVLEKIDTLFTIDTSSFVNEAFKVHDLGVQSMRLPDTINTTYDTVIYLDIKTPSDIRLKEVEIVNGRVSVPILLDTLGLGLQDTIEVTVGVMGSSVATQTLTLPQANRVVTDTMLFDVTKKRVSLNLHPDIGLQHNRLAVQIRISNKQIAKSIPRASLKVNCFFRNDADINIMKWSYVRGYLGFHDFSVPTSSRDANFASFFNSSKLKVSAYTFAGSFLELNSINGVGIPFIVKDTLKFFSQSQLVGTLTDTIFEQYPTLQNPQATNFTKQYRNGVDKILSQKPDSLVSNGHIFVNSGRSPSFDTNQFINAEAKFQLISRMLVPATFSKLDTISYTESISVSDPTLVDTSNVTLDSATFHIKGINYFPVDIDVEFVMKDENNTILDSILIPEKTISSSPVDKNSGDVISGARFNGKVSLKGTQIAHLQKTKKIDLIVRLRKNDSNNLIRFSNYNRLQIGVALDVKTSLKLKL